MERMAVGPGQGHLWVFHGKHPGYSTDGVARQEALLDHLLGTGRERVLERRGAVEMDQALQAQPRTTSATATRAVIAASPGARRARRRSAVSASSSRCRLLGAESGCGGSGVQDARQLCFWSVTSALPIRTISAGPITVRWAAASVTATV